MTFPLDPSNLMALISPSLSFTLPNIDPVVHLGPLALQWGPVAIRWYALAYIAGIGLAWYYAQKLLKQDRLWAGSGGRPIDPVKFDDLIMWLALGIILGGRLFYVFVYNLNETLSNPMSIFTVWNGGMSFHGGFLGVCIAAWLYVRAEKFNRAQVLNLGDLLATVAPIGVGLGRIANFINGELWGRPTDVPWGVVFCNDHIRAVNGGTCGAAGMVPRHPSQLYEAGLEGLGLFVLALVLGQRFNLYKRPGLIWGAFMIGYGLSRMLLELVRTPDSQMPDFLKGSITMGMLLSLPMVIAGAWLIYLALKTPVAEPVAEATPAADVTVAPAPAKPRKRAAKTETKSD